jgi:parallel beta-helix repeat protein
MARQYFLGNIKGPKGDEGSVGLTGEKGDTGNNGTDGVTYDWLSGTSAPSSSTGKQGDMYLRTATQDVYKKTSASSWSLLCNIKGAKGDTGATGAIGATGEKGDSGQNGSNGSNGTDGVTYDWLTGTVAPASTTGKQGDMYLRTSTQDVYKKTSGTVWTFLCNIKGATGATGEKGDTGATGEKGEKGDAGENGTNGTNGADGITYLWLTGTTSPTFTDGKPGDFYLNTSTQDLYRMTSESLWLIICNIKGATGARGSTGAQGVQGIQGIQGEKGDDGISFDWLYGTSAPSSTTGKLGDVYLHVLTQNLYKKVTDSAWQLLLCIKGETGDKGSTGSTGAKGDKGDTGEPGEDGVSFDWLYGTGTPTSSTGKIGDLYLHTLTQNLYKKVNNTSWQLLLCIKGATGDRGSTGATGAKGDTGATGAAGAAGEKGEKGDKGANTTVVVGFTAGCDYIIADKTATNMQTTINSAINSLSSTGGKVLLREGTYNLSGAINMKTDVTLEGMEGATILKRMANYTNGVIYVTGRCTIRGLSIDGNKSECTTTTNHGIYCYRASSALITQNTISNNMGCGIWLGTTSNSNGTNTLSNVITDNIISGNGAQGILFYGVSSDSSYSCSYNKVCRNVCISNGTVGIMFQDPSYRVSCNNNLITGNICRSNGTYGIAMTGYNSTNGNVGSNYNNAGSNNISGNSCTGNTSHGIYLTYAINNTLTGNTCNSNTKSGIMLTSFSKNNVVSGNTCNKNTESGIEVLSSSTYNNVTGNVAVGNTLNGINLAGSYGLICCNNVSQNTGGAIANTGTNNYIFGNKDGDTNNCNAS